MENSDKYCDNGIRGFEKQIIRDNAQILDSLAKDLNKEQNKRPMISKTIGKAAKILAYEAEQLRISIGEGSRG